MPGERVIGDRSCVFYQGVGLTSATCRLHSIDTLRPSQVRQSAERALTQQEVAGSANLSQTANERGLMVFTPTIPAVTVVLGISRDDMRHPDDPKYCL